MGRRLVRLGTGSDAVYRVRRAQTPTIFGEGTLLYERHFERRWAVPRAVYEAGIKGRLRVRIHRVILFVYSPISPRLRWPARAAGDGDGPGAVVAPPSSWLAPVCSAICRFVIACNERGCGGKQLESYAT
jgi:hypothetical protein